MGGSGRADRGVTAVSRVPVTGLTVLYDAGCPLCRHLGDWLRRQPKLVRLDMVPAASEEARRRFPGLDHGATLDEITVVGDAGQVYRGPAAWIVCLWALREHRPLAHRLSTPAGERVARAAVLAAAKWRAQLRPGASSGVPSGVPGRWGGGVYRREDGWVYHPDAGWTLDARGCSDGACPAG
ncbi:thiol-disulfide oxidoreductase DCC family protein [Streptomyces fragilis]|uniref:DCC1-like thiol-disulfide oxidoreductase family protein n=1 Tax=Streptomyces fragilis TaxID=67301 RepID=A0ABV2YII7_9ACTN|nr:DCC1-like thiol-disulfide oxidoreductase family protein [Streptomyces fragilis]